MPGLLSLGSLVSGVRTGLSSRREYLTLTELDEYDRPAIGSAFDFLSGATSPTRRLQYFPETFTDSKSVNWTAKEVPGGSLPIYQWVNSGERKISFTAVFTTDVDHNAEIAGSISSPTARASALAARLRAQGVEERNIWIPGALAWLRRFMLPRYGDTTAVGVPLTLPPRKLRLKIPGSVHLNGGGGGISGPGGIYCIMQSCEITYEAMFPSGDPRVATVSLEFAEVGQKAGRVNFPYVDPETDAAAMDGYTLRGR